MKPKPFLFLKPKELRTGSKADSDTGGLSSCAPCRRLPGKYGLLLQLSGIVEAGNDRQGERWVAVGGGDGVDRVAADLL